jgi:hypothetical protein
MRFVCLAIVVAASIGLLTTVYAAVPAPSPGPRGGDFRPTIAEGCGYGWHWVSTYATLNGAWVAGHCQING